MKFLQLRKALEENEKKIIDKRSRETGGVRDCDQGQGNNKGCTEEISGMVRHVRCGGPNGDPGNDNAPSAGNDLRFSHGWFRNESAPKGRERVEGSPTGFQPVDRNAAMLLWRAPWWAHPPQVTKPENKPNPKQKMSDVKPIKDSSFGPGGDIVTQKSRDEFNAYATSKVIRETSVQLEQTQSLIDKANDARAALDVLSNSWKMEWIDFLKTADERVRELRERRMGMDTETRILMSQLRDVRAFFVDNSYETERSRLKEFVELCERLKALKDSGFLDTVADTLIRLSVGNTSGSDHAT